MFLGIDLGTTNTVVAIGRENVQGMVETEVLTIPQFYAGNMEYHTMLPSVYYCDSEQISYIGMQGKAMRLQQSSRVIYNTKRYMGKDVTWAIDDQTFQARDIAARILQYCKRQAEKQLRRKFSSVVITVPASFNPDQTRDTEDAAVMAGFEREQVRLMHEPTAALLNYIHKQSQVAAKDRIVDFRQKKRIMVFDLGGGTCDVSVIDVEQQDKAIAFNEVAVGRYEELGGVDFDQQAARALLRDFMQKQGIDGKSLAQQEADRMQNKLTIFCEEAKERISSKVYQQLLLGDNSAFNNLSFSRIIPEFYQGKGYQFTLTKQQYDAYTASLYHKPQHTIKTNEEKIKFKNIESPVIDTLFKYNIAADSIDFIFLTGGMSQYINIQERLQQLLNRPIILAPNPMQAVACGAAVYNYYQVQAELEQQEPKLAEKIESTQINIVSVLAEAIMIDVNEGLPEVIIPAQQEVPFAGVLEGRFRTTSPSGVALSVYAGEDPYDSAMRIQRNYICSFQRAVPVGTTFDIAYQINKNKVIEMMLKFNDSDRTQYPVQMESDVKVVEKQDYQFKELEA